MTFFFFNFWREARLLQFADHPVEHVRTDLAKAKEQIPNRPELMHLRPELLNLQRFVEDTALPRLKAEINNGIQNGGNRDLAERTERLLQQLTGEADYRIAFSDNRSFVLAYLGAGFGLTPPTNTTVDARILPGNEARPAPDYVPKYPKLAEAEPYRPRSIVVYTSPDMTSPVVLTRVFQPTDKTALPFIISYLGPPGVREIVMQRIKDTRGVMQPDGREAYVMPDLPVTLPSREPEVDPFTTASPDLLRRFRNRGGTHGDPALDAIGSPRPPSAVQPGTPVRPYQVIDSRGLYGQAGAEIDPQHFAEQVRLGKQDPSYRVLEGIPYDYLRYGRNRKQHNMVTDVQGIELYHKTLVLQWNQLSPEERRYRVSRLQTLRSALGKVQPQHDAQEATLVEAGVKKFTQQQMDAMSRFVSESNIDLSALIRLAPDQLKHFYVEQRQPDHTLRVWLKDGLGRWQGRLLALGGQVSVLPGNPDTPYEKPHESLDRSHALRRIEIPVPPIQGMAGEDFKIRVSIPAGLVFGGKPAEISYHPRNQTFDQNGVDIANEAGIAFEPVFATGTELGRQAVRGVRLYFLRPGIFAVNNQQVGVEPPSPSDRPWPPSGSPSDLPSAPGPF